MVGMQAAKIVLISAQFFAGLPSFLTDSNSLTVPQKSISN